MNVTFKSDGSISSFNASSGQTVNDIIGIEAVFGSLGHDQITGSDDDIPFTLQTEPGLQDPATAQQTIIKAIESGKTDMVFRILDGDTVEDRRFETSKITGFRTELGCVDAVKVERIRDNSKRYTIAWYAPGAGYALLRLDHGKQAEDDNSLRIKRLVVDGVWVHRRRP